MKILVALLRRLICGDRRLHRGNTVSGRDSQPLHGSEDQRGVVKRPKQPMVRPSMPDMTKERLGGHKQYAGSEALALAQANKDKPWARRWLRAHGYWL